MKTLTVKASKNYDVNIGSGLLAQAGEMIARVHKICHAFLITDDTVDALYAPTVTASLESAGFTVTKFVFPHGEASKNMSTFTQALEAMASAQLTRSDIAVALGGGVVGDLTGFTAACYLRGIDFVQIPTTLLAAVDSSVGGKTAVDLTAGKNLVGAFHQPIAVICDTDTLATLPEEYMADGFAEALKMGLITSPRLFDMIYGDDKYMDRLEDIIYNSVGFKAAIVENDEFDTGLRQLLNFGHTVGHAIEKLSDFSISHGHAVAMGMSIVTHAADKLYLTEYECASTVDLALDVMNLPKKCEFSAKELAQAALSDKKRKGSEITLVIPVSIGRCELHKIGVDKLEEFIAAGLE